MTAWVILWCLWMLAVWYQVRFWLPARKAIIGCEHGHGTIKECNKNAYGRAQDLVWFCDSCPLQVPLVLQRVGAELKGEKENSVWVYWR